MKKRTLLVAVSGCLGLSMAWSQAKFPDRPITLVVPSAPGGTTDFTARLIAEPLSRALGQPVVVDNKAGASGNIGNQAVAKAKADGYTLLLAYSGYQVGNPHLFKKAGWDPIKDFAPVAMLTRAPQVLAARANLPANNLRELIAYAKANPDKLNYASSGNGSIQHIAGELFKQMTGTEIQHIPYKGAGPAVQDLLGAQVDLFFTTPASVVSHIKADKLKGLAVTSNARLTSLPQVPTARESDLKDFTLDSWFALYAPAGTPAEVVQVLSNEVGKILATAEVKKKAEEAGTQVDYMGPAALADYTRKELAFWGRVIQSAKISAD
ncbi:Bug family tripartite tricarboxylate transporter substrate binding protein [Limnohabitans radicicola]|uniref:Tripartite tricarboxylate transporter substrate binding protein n=1 Tax=Limnohabitans radicicola TaxID=2771427 RepID=A0A927IN31_9BURK|nr:tripartite tricarboxylate transporter substrate binding protein [Limnohabitans radicicola]MBD8051637.1 tripartite tricarboxylate transporter substrate binding protein [Limnohabitans radicicola]